MPFTARAHAYFIGHTRLFNTVTLVGKYLLLLQDDHGEISVRSKPYKINNGGEAMSLTRAMGFSCPYCMAPNDVEIDEMYDVGQTQVLDCQVCCQPIELSVYQHGDDISIQAEREND